MSAASLPPGRLLSWYGDDFTGSAAVMEVLAFGGIPAVLFLDAPTPAQLARFPEARAIGIAGVARSQTPDWMDVNLPPIFEALAALGSSLTHYKICSTLDSSPTIGSIGHAVELAAPVLGGSWYPTLVAAPPLGRWQAFGHLFAASGDRVHRLDRHPVMSRHPVTPMDESDVARHLSRQTQIPCGCLDLLALRAPDGGDAALAAMLEQGSGIVTLDCMDEADLAAAGRLIWMHRQPRLLTIGSQGVEYALMAHWRAVGALAEPPPPRSAGRIDRIVAVSGSVSPTTAAQIDWAASHGFGLVAFDAAAVVDPAARAAAIAASCAEAASVLAAGQSVLIHSARGPDDPAVDAFRAAVSGSQLAPAAANGLVGESLGQVLAQLLERTALQRAVISGGDSAGHATLQLGVEALTALAPTIPGAALCTAHRRDGTTLQLALKGGQMGTPDYFGWIRDGGGPRNQHN